MATRVAVLGLGIMGSEMARNAARAGLETVGWDRKTEHTLALASNGVTAAKTPQDAVQGAAVVVTMVADGNAVLSVMENYGAFAAMKPKSCWVQMSTIGVEGTESAVRLASTRPEIAFVDAPVSGSKGTAEEGMLVIFASGDCARGGEAVEKFFDAIGSRTHWLGEAGQGTRMKLLFNAWLGMLNEAVAEVAILGESLGISPKDFGTLAQGGPLVPSWAVAKLQKIANDQTQETEFPLRWAHKDILLALSAAGEQRSDSRCSTRSLLFGRTQSASSVRTILVPSTLHCRNRRRLPVLSYTRDSGIKPARISTSAQQHHWAILRAVHRP